MQGNLSAPCSAVRRHTVTIDSYGFLLSVFCLLHLGSCDFLGQLSEEGDRNPEQCPQPQPPDVPVATRLSPTLNPLGNFCPSVCLCHALPSAWTTLELYNELESLFLQGSFIFHMLNQHVFKSSFMF